MKKIKVIFITFLLPLLFNSTYAQKKLAFGLDVSFHYKETLNVLADSSSYGNFFKQFNIQYLRFPGGSPTRYYMYSNNALSTEAKKSLQAYYQTRGRKEMKIIEDKVGLPDDYYIKFLAFCKRNSITPIIQLNTCFYEANEKLFQVAQFNKQNIAVKPLNNNNDLKNYINNQLNLTHKYFQNVTWEIGNEDYAIYDAKTFADIVRVYEDLIKSQYPNDKVIVTLANAYGEEKSKDFKNKWNINFVRELNTLNLLPKIDYFAPHFYVDVFKEVHNQQELNNRLADLNFKEFEDVHLAYFPKNYHPRFFYTEFATFLQSSNINYNTDLHALMLLYYLMNFYSSQNIDGVIYQGFTAKGSALFYNQAPFAGLQAVNDLPKAVAFVPLQTKAIKLFYDNVGSQVVNFKSQNNVYTLVTKNSNSSNIYFVLNFSNKTQTVNLNNITNDKAYDFYQFGLQNLQQKSNAFKYIKRTLTGDKLSEIEVPSYSFSIVR